MKKRYLKHIVLILSIILFCLSAIYIHSYQQTKIIDSRMVRLKVTNLIIRSHFDSFWQGEMYKHKDWLENISQEDRVEYFVAVLYTLTDKLQQNGEANLIYYENLPEEDKSLLYKKLDGLESSTYFESLNDIQKDYVISFKELLKLSQSAN